jgi:uncharacterized membrane protein
MNPYEENELNRMRLDPENYKWGVFYYCPRDPRVILPKRNVAMGFTLNFARPGAWVVLAGIFTFAAVMAILGPMLS